MEINSDKKSILFYKISGVLYTLLPFCGNYESWARLLIYFCKNAKQIWKDNTTVFKEINKTTKWNYSAELEELYLKYWNRDVKFNNKLQILFEMDTKEDVDFLRDALKFKFSDLKYLRIYYYDLAYSEKNAIIEF